MPNRKNITHCLRGHEYTPGNTRWSQPRKIGVKPIRLCIACRGSVPVHKGEHGHREWARNRWKVYRLEVVAAYGGVCACCGESWFDFLHIDHIQHGTGNRDRAERRTYGARLLWWLRKTGYPAGFQVLCANCNHAKGLQRDCPPGHDQRVRDHGRIACA